METDEERIRRNQREALERWIDKYERSGAGRIEYDDRILAEREAQLKRWETIEVDLWNALGGEKALQEVKDREAREALEAANKKDAPPAAAAASSPSEMTCLYSPEEVDAAFAAAAAFKNAPAYGAAAAAPAVPPSSGPSMTPDSFCADSHADDSIARREEEQASVSVPEAAAPEPTRPRVQNPLLGSTTPPRRSMTMSEALGFKKGSSRRRWR